VKRFDYLFRFSKDPSATAAKMRPAALSASVRTRARGTPSVRAILLSIIAKIAAHSRAKTASSNRSIRETVARVARPGLPGFKRRPYSPFRPSRLFKEQTFFEQ
jgi:hypothetical protein